MVDALKLFTDDLLIIIMQNKFKKDEVDEFEFGAPFYPKYKYTLFIKYPFYLKYKNVGL